MVSDFKNAPYAEGPPDRTYGFDKDSMKTAELLQRMDFPDNFLRSAFDFTFRPSLIGVCTSYHEKVCYKQLSIGDPKAVEIAFLLGKLVDSAKAGITFTDEHWSAFRKERKLPRSLKPPAYKDKDGGKPKNPQHISDKLLFEVAEGVSKKALQDFSRDFKDVPAYDPDLTKIWRDEEAEAPKYPGRKELLANLKKDLAEIRDSWKINASTRRRQSDGIKALQDTLILSFNALVEKCRYDFLNIAPSESPGITKSELHSRWQHGHLEKNWHGHYWNLLKASALFAIYRGDSLFVWYTAGIELGEMKAKAKGMGTYRVVVNPIYETYKADRKLVEAKRRRDEASAMANTEILDDADDEFGYWDWDDVD